MSDLECANYSAIFNSLLRVDLASFINKTFNTINPGIKFQPNWHINLIANHLEHATYGKIKRLIINIPPRSLKSICVSVAWPAWILGKNPTKRIIVACYAQNLSTKHSIDTKTIITSKWYQELYPNTILSRKQNMKYKFMTTKHGFRLASSVGGSITGEGGDILIIDDPHNPTYINSTKIRNKAIEWFEQTLLTRLNDKNKGTIVLIMQRLHTEDLSGYLLKNTHDLWKVLRIPAIAEKEYRYEIGKEFIAIRPGDVLHQARDKLENLQIIQNELGIHNFAAQYLQSPMQKTIGLLEHNMIQYYDQYPKNIDFTVQSWDTAIKINDNNDYTACTTWGVSGKYYYLLNIFRERLSYPKLKILVTDYMTKGSHRYILIEDKASGQSLIQDLKSQGIINIFPQKPKLDKVTRFSFTIPYFESGNVLIPRSASWLALFLSEITSFPYGKHDDIVDSVSQFINFMRNYNSKNRVCIRTIW
ncbi:terminase-like family protein [Orientia chuto str. Dubai]|uniref:Terminase-like family protein n=1 Tax=Orientia chuto str. Dubai TaxID=1359168 RepID=A0A0F3ML00_9RICK|nr:phage terminase large subunit [Candidatus Orientia mediorientalis]KJV56122.1 terminase-like family protein [Orientia chuto str. Dubai]